MDLWDKVAKTAASALASGALQPIQTRCEDYTDGAVTFQLREVVAHSRKPPPGASPRNPFLPYDPELLVAKFGTTHVGLLNKFNVVAQHLLVVTRAFEPQHQPLTRCDFDVASLALAAGPALLFFNSGEAAGASQQHRHLQLVPLPLSQDPGGFPLAQHLANGVLPVTYRWLPTAGLDHAVRAEAWASFYAQSIAELQLLNGPGQPLHPYNLLATAAGMAIIPRSQGSWEGISVNAMGYAGLLLVKNRSQRQLLQQRGAWELLRQVGVANLSAG